MDRVVRRVRRALRALARRAPRGEKGQAYLETLLVMPLLLVLIVGVMYFWRVYYAKIAAEEAAYDCTRTAVEAMREEKHGAWPGGQIQGTIAAREALAGFYLDAGQASVSVVPLETWGRGQAVRCDVRYGVDLSSVPLLEWIAGDPTLSVWARGVGQVEAYKSKWP